MGVVHFKEIHGRSATEDYGKRREYTRTFQAITADDQDTAYTVRAHAAVPNRGDTYRVVTPSGTIEDANARCVFVRVTNDDGDNPRNWTVVAEYRGEDDPLFAPAEVKWGTVPYQAAKLKDTAGAIYRNSAGDVFEGGRLVDADRFVLTIVRNVPAASWNPIDMEPYQNSLNSDPFLAVRHPPGLAFRTCKLKMTADLVWYDGSKTEFYWRRTATIEYRKDTWVGKVRDAGYREIITGKFANKPQPIILENGARPTSPQLLDGAGSRLAVGLDPVELTFADYETRAWGALDLEY
jgi:hypothetical protein